MFFTDFTYITQKSGSWNLEDFDVDPGQGTDMGNYFHFPPHCELCFSKYSF